MALTGNTNRPGPVDRSRRVATPAAGIGARGEGRTAGGAEDRAENPVTAGVQARPVLAGAIRVAAPAAPERPFDPLSVLYVALVVTAVAATALTFAVSRVGGDGTSPFDPPPSVFVQTG